MIMLYHCTVSRKKAGLVEKWSKVEVRSVV